MRPYNNTKPVLYTRCARAKYHTQLAKMSFETKSSISQGEFFLGGGYK